MTADHGIVGYALILSLGPDFQRLTGRGPSGDYLFPTEQEAEAARLTRGHPEHWQIAAVTPLHRDDNA